MTKIRTSLMNDKPQRGSPEKGLFLVVKISDFPSDKINM